mmetsp:Transcript_60817/g.144922  ORF Transcript_60817/g.144922 Transcript_60817/m.144922 type:complete len:248 (+) Transcript_60817:40-783(+)
MCCVEWWPVFTSRATRLLGIDPARRHPVQQGFGGPWGAPYVALLDHIEEKGYADDLPLDPQGVLAVNVPFCAGFVECPILLRWLQRLMERCPAITRINVLAVDLDKDFERAWQQKMEWAAKQYPNISLQLRPANLLQETLPEAGLTLCMHPGPITEQASDPWPQIMTTVLKAVATNGFCVFAVFSQHELRAVVKTCSDCAMTTTATTPNPYYETHPAPLPCLAFCGPLVGFPYGIAYMRYLHVVHRG